MTIDSHLQIIANNAQYGARPSALQYMGQINKSNHLTSSVDEISVYFQQSNNRSHRLTPFREDVQYCHARVALAR